MSIHGFCDASLLLCAAVVYVRSYKPNDVHVSLLTSKTKVAPIKGHTIPRLELLSCVLLSELMKVTLGAIDHYVDVTDVKYWTDSCIAWIKGCNREWKPWAENRVNKIRDFTMVDNWCHVPGTLNPADIPTRKINVINFSNCVMWWNGPDFLSKKERLWPSQNIQTSLTSADIIKEFRKAKIETSCNSVEPKFHHPLSNLESVILMKNYSSLIKLLKITGYVMRFIRNLKNSFSRKNAIKEVPEEKLSGPLTVVELENGEKMWIKYEQRTILANKKFPDLKKQLGLFQDEEELLRLRGRFQNTSWDFEQKHPALLPRYSHLTKLIIWKAHTEVQHAGIPSILKRS